MLILKYTIITVLGILTSIFSSFATKKEDDEKLKCGKKILKDFKERKGTYFLILFLNLIIFWAITYFFGDFLKNGKFNFIQFLNFSKYIAITPLLIVICYTDLAYRSVSNRVNLLLFEIGIIYMVIFGIINIHTLIDSILGFGIALLFSCIISFFGKVVLSEETLGFSNIKSLLPLGLLFGKVNIINILLVSYLLLILFGGIMLLFKFIFKKQEKYSPFALFIAASVFIVVALPENYVITKLIYLAHMLVN